MGQQISIYKIAERIIRLSGKTIQNKKNPNGDISIKIIGLKKGEKIKEELTLGDNLKNTSHPEIMHCDEDIDILNFKSDLRKDKRIVAKDKLAAILNKIVPISLIIYILWFYAHHVSYLRWHIIFIMFSENLIGNKITFTI